MVSASQCRRWFRRCGRQDSTRCKVLRSTCVDDNTVRGRDLHTCWLQSAAHACTNSKITQCARLLLLSDGNSSARMSATVSVSTHTCERGVSLSVAERVWGSCRGTGSRFRAPTAVLHARANRPTRFGTGRLTITSRRTQGLRLLPLPTAEPQDRKNAVLSRCCLWQGLRCRQQVMALPQSAATCTLLRCPSEMQV